MACMDEYARCLGEKGIQMIQEQAQGAVLLFRFLCDDPGFQSGNGNVAAIIVSKVLFRTLLYDRVSKNFKCLSLSNIL